MRDRFASAGDNVHLRACENKTHTLTHALRQAITCGSLSPKESLLLLQQSTFTVLDYNHKTTSRVYLFPLEAGKTKRLKNKSAGYSWCMVRVSNTRSQYISHSSRMTCYKYTLALFQKCVCLLPSC